MSNFILSLPLYVNTYSYKKLESRFNAAHHLYNACLSECERRKEKYLNHPSYLAAKDKFKSGDKLAARALYGEARKEAGFYFMSSAKNGKSDSVEQWAARNVQGSWLKSHITSDVSSTIAERAFVACEKTLAWIKGKGKFKKAKVRFKSLTRQPLFSLEGKSSKSPLRLKDRVVVWNGLILPLIVKDGDTKANYELSDKVQRGMIRIKRKDIRGKWHYFVDIVCSGTPFLKMKNSLGTGVIGLDVGPNTIAYASNSKVSLDRIFIPAIMDTAEVKRLQRRIDKQRRRSNPNKFNEDGTIKTGNKEKWVVSKRQKKNEVKVANILRKTAESRRCSHGKICNKLRRLGSIVKVDNDSYKGWQEAGYGRSIGNSAPGTLITLIKNKFEMTGGQLILVDTRKSKSSQTCPQCGRIEKKGKKENKDSRSIRIHKCECGLHYQRDLVSAIINKYYETETSILNVDESRKFIVDNESVLQAGIQELIQSVREGQILTSTSGPVSELEQIACNGKSENLLVTTMEAGQTASLES